MPALRLLGFDGLLPKMSATLMGDQFAQVATNVKLYSKELRYWRESVPIPDAAQPPNLNYKTLFRLFNSVGGSVFLLWTTEVDVAVSPVADAGESRFYYTGDGTPKKSNYAMATAGAQPYPATWMEMGVPGPTAPPTVALTTAGTGIIEDRYYVYTNVSTFGLVKAESGPSPPHPAALQVPSVGSTVTVTLPASVPAGSYNITHRRIYRTVVGATTESYQFVVELPVATASYADSLTVAQLGEVMTVGSWGPPPATLQGLVSLPGGALAGFVGNTVYFSVPYYPHAWPAAYAITIPVLKIVGLGVVGSSVAVMTETTPYFIHGGVPGEMYVEKIPIQEPCVAKATIAVSEDGVLYASPNGLVALSPSTRSLVTKDLFTADEWKPLGPQNMKAAVLRGRYFGVFPNEIPPRAIILASDDPPALSTMQLPAVALHVDARNGAMFFVRDGTDPLKANRIYELDAAVSNGVDVPMNYSWRSKRFFVEKAQTFSLLRVDADYDQLGITNQAAYDAAVVWNNAHFPGDIQGSINGAAINTWDINGSVLWNLPATPSRWVQVKLYGDQGQYLFSTTLFNSDPVRVTPFKSRRFEVEINGNISVRTLHVATTIEELHAT